MCVPVILRRGPDRRLTLDKHIYSEIAELLNQQGYRPGGSARRSRHDARFTALRVAYLVQRYGLRSRYDRLRDRGMQTKREAAASLNTTPTKRPSPGGLNMGSLPGRPTMRTITCTRSPSRTRRVSNAVDGNSKRHHWLFKLRGVKRPTTHDALVSSFFIASIKSVPGVKS